MIRVLQHGRTAWEGYRDTVPRIGEKIAIPIEATFSTCTVQAVTHVMHVPGERAMKPHPDVVEVEVSL